MAPLVLMIVRLLSEQGVPVDVCADRTVVLGARCPLSLVQPGGPSAPVRFDATPPPSRYDPEASERQISNGF